MIEAGTSRSNPRSSVRKLWLGGAAIVVAAVAVISFILLLIRDEGYGPLDAGPASGVGGPGVRSAEGGGVDEFTLGRGAAYYFSLLENGGSHAVEVTRIPHDAAMADVRWAPAVKADEVYFEPGRWRPLPATVPADGTIQIRVTVRRPESCAHLAKDVHEVYTGEYFARWRSRRSAHESRIDQVDPRHILLC